MTEGPEKVRENRLRRMAERQGYQLRKSPRRDPYARDYGGYMLVDPARPVNHPRFVVQGGKPYAFSASLDDIEMFLTSEDRDERRMSAWAAQQDRSRKR